MSYSLFPQGEGASTNSDPDQEKVELKRPQFILIDDRNGERQYTHFDADASPRAQDSSQSEQASKGPLSLRFICLLGFIFCAIFGFGVFLLSIALTVLATFSLFQNKNLIQGMCSFWKIFINTFIAGFGFTLGMISPVLGLGLLALYFSLASNLVEDDLLRKVIRRSFSHL